jgi:hypothetical protein
MSSRVLKWLVGLSGSGFDGELVGKSLCRLFVLMNPFAQRIVGAASRRQERGWTFYFLHLPKGASVQGKREKVKGKIKRIQAPKFMGQFFYFFTYSFHQSHPSPKVCESGRNKHLEKTFPLSLVSSPFKWHNHDDLLNLVLTCVPIGGRLH